MINYQDFLTQDFVISFFYKAFVITLAIIYVFYSIVLVRQVKVMLEFIRGRTYNTMILISKLQILLSIIILILAIFI